MRPIASEALRRIGEQVVHGADIGGDHGQAAGEHLVGLLREAVAPEGRVQDGDDAHIQGAEQVGHLSVRQVAEIVHAFALR